MRLAAAVLILSSFAVACSPKASAPPTSSPPTSGFDAALADRLGADEYGMHQYVVALLRAGPNRSDDPEVAMELQRAHMANIQRLAEEGKLIFAGPFMDDTELRGIYVFDVATVEEARALTQTDPAIQQGALVMELHPFYGSAALREVNAIHERIAEKNP